VRYRAANLRRWLIFAQTLVDDSAQQIIVGPGEILDLRDQLGPHPVYAAEDLLR
jgi:hypothetical protein